jgi:hypothetical protein
MPKQDLSPTVRLSAEEFQQAVEKKRFSEQTLEIAYKLLVDGQSETKLAEEYSLTRQRVNKIGADIYAAFLKNALYPPGWIRAVIVASPDMIDTFRATAEKERYKYFSGKKR